MAGNEVLEVDMKKSGEESTGLPPVFNSLSEIDPSQFTMRTSRRMDKGYVPKKHNAVVSDRLFFRKNESKVEEGKEQLRRSQFMANIPEPSDQ